MPRAIQEIQLIAVKAIPRRQRHQHGEDDAAHPDHAPAERAGDRHHGSGAQGLPRSLAGSGGGDRAGRAGLAQPGQRPVAAGAGCPGVAGWIIAGGCVPDCCSFGAESGGKPGGDAPRSGPPSRPLLLSARQRTGRCPPGGQTPRPTGIHRRPRGRGARRVPWLATQRPAIARSHSTDTRKADADIEASPEEMTPSSARAHPDAPDTTSSPGQMKTRHLPRHIQPALAKVTGELTS